VITFYYGSGSGSDFLTSYGSGSVSGSGSTRQKLRFLRFRFHNTVCFALLKKGNRKNQSLLPNYKSKSVVTLCSGVWISREMHTWRGARRDDLLH
jgi:hypothetical protein